MAAYLVFSLDMGDSAEAHARPSDATYAPVCLSTLSVHSSVHVAMGIPTDVDSSDDCLLDRGAYVASYNRARNAANWVAWRVEASDFGPVRRHKGHFFADAGLPEGFYRVRHEDYSGSGYTRGHLVRSAERTHDVASNEATFLMTNILPQTSALNEGPWAKLEADVEQRVRREGNVAFAVAGGIFSIACDTRAGALPSSACPGVGRGNKRVAVPSAFFKVIVFIWPGDSGRSLESPKGATVVAVAMPNVDGILSESWRKYAVTREEVEARTGYRIFDKVGVTGEESRGGFERR